MNSPWEKPHGHPTQADVLRTEAESTVIAAAMVIVNSGLTEADKRAILVRLGMRLINAAGDFGTGAIALQKRSVFLDRVLADIKTLVPR